MNRLIAAFRRRFRRPNRTTYDATDPAWGRYFDETDLWGQVKPWQVPLLHHIAAGKQFTVDAPRVHGRPDPGHLALLHDMQTSLQLRFERWPWTEFLASSRPHFDASTASEIMGRRADLIIVDDVQSPNALRDSTPAREWYDTYIKWRRNRPQEEQWQAGPDRTMAGVGLWSE